MQSYLLNNLLVGGSRIHRYLPHPSFLYSRVFFIEWVSSIISKLSVRSVATAGADSQSTLSIQALNDDGMSRSSKKTDVCSGTFTIIQKLLAEVMGTYFVIFAGCGSVAVNKIYGQVTFPGICVTWGLIVMVMIYTVGHVSGAHFNPSVTLTLVLFRRHPILEGFLYIVAQVLGSVLASATLDVIFDITPEAYFGTLPVGSNIQSLVMEIIITFLLMFVVLGVTSDSRARSELGGIAVGMTILLNVLVAGPISGASMNPARSIGPAIIKHNYKAIWVYIVGPVAGAIAGAVAYQALRSRNSHDDDTHDSPNGDLV